MEQITFNGMFIVALSVLIGLAGAIITPMLKLNTSITTLNNTMQSLIKNDGKQDEIIQKHDDKLHEHDKRIYSLEQK